MFGQPFSWFYGATCSTPRHGLTTAGRERPPGGGGGGPPAAPRTPPAARPRPRARARPRMKNLSRSTGGCALPPSFNK